MTNSEKTISDISVVLTTYNEAKSIVRFCNSLVEQTTLPRQIIIVDAESTDNTVKLFQSSLSDLDPRVALTIIVKKCNISEGRNLAIINSISENIGVTDAGVTLAPNWVKSITSGLSNSAVVGGYYEYTGENWIQRAYRDLFYKPASAVDKSTFLPSSRSLGFKKYIWKKAGGYNTTYPIGEDTDFDFRIKSAGHNILFCPDAVVRWETRGTLRSLFIQHFRYSHWDAVIGQNRLGHIKFIIYLITLTISLPLSIYDPTLILVPLLIALLPAISKKKLPTAPIVIIANTCYLAKAAGFATGLGHVLFKNT